MLVNVVPYPPHGGVQSRVWNLVRRIAAHHDVTLGCHSWDDEDEDGVRWLCQHGIPTISARLTAANRRHVGPALRGMASTGQPPEVVQFRAAKIAALVAEARFDVLQIEETLLAPYERALPATSSAQTVLTLHNIHFSQEHRIAAIEPDRAKRLWRQWNARMMRRYEPAAAARFDRLVAVSPDDRELLLAAAPGLRVDVLPNGVDTQALQPLPASKDDGPYSLIFVGTLGYRPCADAVIWFVTAILPLIRRALPDVEFWIVGRQPPPEVEALAAARVFITGFVADLIPYYRRAAVVVVPLRAGGGTRLKILEAMALGRPIVSTAIGAEGIDAIDGVHLTLADHASDFAAAVVALLADPQRRRAIAAQARALVEQRYDWDPIAARQLAIYEELATSSSDPRVSSGRTR